MQKSHQSQAEGGFQSVVISLKDMFYDKADALIGVSALAPASSSKPHCLEKHPRPRGLHMPPGLPNVQRPCG
jgi:hypothetical protein